jgi:hypothetical protein
MFGVACVQRRLVRTVTSPCGRQPPCSPARVCGRENGFARKPRKRGSVRVKVYGMRRIWMEVISGCRRNVHIGVCAATVYGPTTASTWRPPCRCSSTFVQRSSARPRPSCKSDARARRTSAHSTVPRHACSPRTFRPLPPMCASLSSSPSLTSPLANPHHRTAFTRIFVARLNQLRGVTSRRMTWVPTRHVRNPVLSELTMRVSIAGRLLRLEDCWVFVFAVGVRIAPVPHSQPLLPLTPA